LRETGRFKRKGRKARKGNANGFLLAAIATTLLLANMAAAQPAINNVYKSQEISEADGLPVIVKHLPDYEQVRSRAVFAKNAGDLKKALGERSVLDQIDFTGGTEAVAAPYEAGKLLIIEYSSPQASVEADQRFTAAVAGDSTIAYRRIGNYNALVFDVADPAAAGALLDQVKYQKQIQWLGENPFNRIRERNFILTTTDMFLSTVLVIVIGIVLSLLCGAVAGYFYFLFREKQRAHLSTYTDAGGMTRLNLDGFTPDIMPDRMLGE